MTENQGRQPADPYPGTSGVPAGTPAPPTSEESTSIRTHVAKDEAANVAGRAAGAAQNVAATAKDEAANVASEVKTSMRELMDQVKSDLASQAETQQRKAAEGIHAISSQLRAMADAPDQQSVVPDLIRQAADRSAAAASWLENRDPGSLLEDAKAFARQRPVTFLLLAAGAGLVAGRVGRSLQAGAPASTPPNATTVPPRPTQAPVPPTPRHHETVIAAGTGDHFFDRPTMPGTAGSAATLVPTADNDSFTGVEGRLP